MTFLFVVTVLVGAPASPALTPEEMADGAFRARASEARAREALSRYRELWPTQERADLGWKLAMACQFVGHRLTTDSDEKKLLFQEGRDAAGLALEKNPDCSPCHFWKAVNMALYGKEAGVFNTLATLGEVREHLGRAAALDPAQAFGGPYRILGAIQQNLPGILGGSYAEARAYFERAIAASPTALNYSFVALLIDEEKGPREAAEYARKVLAHLDPPPSSEVESREAWESLDRISRFQDGT